jgi:hypothetical protein
MPIIGRSGSELNEYAYVWGLWMRTWASNGKGALSAAMTKSVFMESSIVRAFAQYVTLPPFDGLPPHISVHDDTRRI